MSSAASDTVFAYMMFLNAFDTKLVDEEGNFLVDQPETREGRSRRRELHQALSRRLRPARRRELAGRRQQRQLQEPDLLHGAQSVAVDPGFEYENKDRYMNQMVTMETAGQAGRRLIEHIASIKTAVIFEEAQNKEAAKEFMRFTSSRKISGRPRASLARWFPVDQRIIDMPFWHAKDDPHKVVEVAQYTQRPQSVWPHYLNYKLIDINAGRTPTARRSAASSSRTGRPRTPWMS